MAASSRQTVLKVESTPGKVCTGERLNQQRGMADERNVQLRSDHLSCRVRIEVLLRSFVVTQAKLLTNKQVVMKKALGETQTLPVRRSQKNVAPRRPLPGCAGWPKFNELERVTTCTYRPSLVKIDARNFELSW